MASLKKTENWFSRPIYRLMQVKSNAECSKGSILQYFRPSLSYHLSLRPLFCLFLSGRFKQVSIYCTINLPLPKQLFIIAVVSSKLKCCSCYDVSSNNVLAIFISLVFTLLCLYKPRKYLHMSIHSNYISFAWHVFYPFICARSFKIHGYKG